MTDKGSQADWDDDGRVVVTDWKVTVYGAWTDEDYDSPDGIIACWIIKDRTEQEASKEAAMEVQRMGDEVADWTMGEAK